MTSDELQTLCLKHRLSVEDVFRNTGHKPNDIRGWLSGKKKIPWYVTEESLTKKS
jgi:hypothetical protein